MKLMFPQHELPEPLQHSGCSINTGAQQALAQAFQGVVGSTNQRNSSAVERGAKKPKDFLLVKG